LPTIRTRPRQAAADGVYCLAEAAGVLGGSDGDSAARAVALLVEEAVRLARERAGGEVGAAAGGDEAAREVVRRGLGAARGVDAFWLGEAYQHLLDGRAGGGGRRASGVFYTPGPLAERLTAEAVGCLGACAVPRVMDPACGTGAFLVAAARRIGRGLGAGAREGLALRLHGIDIDPLAVELCRLALWLELGRHGEPSSGPWCFADTVRLGDALLDERESCFDLVLGNPPFLGQLRSSNALAGARREALRRRFGEVVGAYTDPAAVFLRLAMGMVAPGGAVGMVLPCSVLASRDAEAVRRHVRGSASLRWLWLDSDRVFGAQVHTVSLVVRRGEAGGVCADVAACVRRAVGSGFREAPAADAGVVGPESWGPLACDLLGVPRVEVRGASGLAEVADVTAGFRDEYYAVARRVREVEGLGGTVRGVVTVGLVEPGRAEWGARSARIGGCLWARPGVEADPSDGVLERVLARQAHPKLIVATQSRVLEVAPDEAGRFVATTPCIVVTPRDPEDLWRLGAWLASPQVSALVAARSFGAARSLGAIKPSASLLRSLPAPEPAPAWEEAGRLFREAVGADSVGDRAALLCECAACGLRAGGFGPRESEALLAWWRGRLPQSLREHCA
jgi:hypothetical protein